MSWFGMHHAHQVLARAEAARLAHRSRLRGRRRVDEEAMRAAEVEGLGGPGLLRRLLSRLRRPRR